MFQNTLEVSSKQIPYFRNEEFSKVVLETENILKDLIHAPLGSRIVFLTSSGTGAMEASVANFLRQDDHVLIINGGTFGQRFCNICERYRINYTQLKVDTAVDLTEEQLDAFSGKGITALLVNMHETSIGKLYDHKVIHNFVKKNNVFLMADCISTFLADEYDMQKIGANVSIVSSQKALALAPGLSFIVMDSTAIERCDKSAYNGLYFNIKTMLEEMNRGQTPFTPAVGILYQLYDRVKNIADYGGEKAEIERCRSNAAYFRTAIRKYPLCVPRYHISNCLTPIQLKDNQAQVLRSFLSERYKIYVNPCGGQFADKMLRVGHIGNLSLFTHEKLVKALGDFFG